MSPHIFEGLRVNQNVYQTVLMTVIKLCIEEVAAGRLYAFQQDTAPVHTGRKTQKFSNDVISDMWPPSSHDFSPIDYMCETRLKI